MKFHLNKQKQLGSVAANDYCLLIAILIAIFVAVLQIGPMGIFYMSLSADVAGILGGVDDMDGSDG